MKENRTLAIGIITAVVGFSLVGALVYFGLRQTVTAVSPMPTIPVENVAPGNTVFEINAQESEARFKLNEVLRGVDNLVVGTSSNLAGQIAFNPEDLSLAQVGTIAVDARTLTTDSNLRNNTLRNDILFAFVYEQIIFQPTGISGLPDTITVGEEVTFDLTGELTIRDITNPVTFSVTAQLITPERLEGLATTTVTRSAYELQIPSVPGVANVDDEVVVEFDFVADQVQ
jgi:polyisoprenoid-binding protein YceI